MNAKRSLLRFLFPLWLALLILIIVVPLNAQEIMPLNQVKPGMKGYGLTVFEGTMAEKFNFKVVDIYYKNSVPLGRYPEILVLLSGGPIGSGGEPIIKEARVIAGMSGSPLFISNKIIGSIASTYAFAQQPFAWATPIESTMDFQPPMASFPNQAVFENKVISEKLRNSPSLINLGDSYVTCRMWGDASACYSGTITLVHQKDSTFFFALGHSENGVGLRALPFWKGRVLSVIPNILISNKVVEKHGPMLGSIIFNGPFGQVGRVGTFPASVPIKITIENYLARNWEKNVFIAYTPQLSAMAASLLSGHRELLGGVLDFEIEAKIHAKGLPPIYSRGLLREMNTAGLTLEKLSGMPQMPVIEGVHVLLRARQPYQILKLEEAEIISAKNKNGKIEVSCKITADSEKNNWEKTFSFFVDKKYLGKKISISDGESLAEKIIQTMIPGEKEIKLLNEVSERDALYAFYSPPKETKKQDLPPFLIMLSGAVSGEIKTSSKEGRENAKALSNQSDQWKQNLKTESPIEIFYKIDLPDKNHIANGSKDINLEITKEKTSKKTKRFWLF